MNTTAESTPLETVRLILRPWQESDAEELYRYAQDPEVGPIAGWPPHQSVEESREIIKTVFSVPENYAVVLKDTMLPVGCAGFLFGEDGNVELAPAEAEIGYWVGVPYWGQGLIPEAVEELNRHAFEDLGLDCVWCTCDDTNQKSKRVMEKCGFIYHHTTEDVPCELMGDMRTNYATCLTKDQWIERRKDQRKNVH